jgi:hypothetical protein
MELYVDDNLTEPGLTGMLRRAGHTVIRPADVQRSGVSDARHMEFAIRHSYVVLTADRRDFRELHDVIIAAGGHHPGILIVCYDNDPKRDMRAGHIVRALTKLERAGIPVAKELIILNHWR